MERIRLQAAVRQAAEAAGYAFATGERVDVLPGIRTLPACWLFVPVRTRAHTAPDRICYRAEMLLCRRSEEGADPTETVAALEEDLTRLTDSLRSHAAVRWVSYDRTEAACGGWTPHGETSLRTTLEVEMLSDAPQQTAAR